MGKSNKKGEAALRLLPLSITIASSAIIMQQAGLARRAQMADDALMPPITDYLSPAVQVLMAAGYLVALIAAATPSTPRRWWPSRHRPCRPAGHPDCTESPDRDNNSASC